MNHIDPNQPPLTASLMRLAQSSKIAASCRKTASAGPPATHQRRLVTSKKSIAAVALSLLGLVGYAKPFKQRCHRFRARVMAAKSLQTSLGAYFTATALVMAFLTLTGLTGAQSLYAQAKDKTVNIYSYRQEFLIRPLLDDFTQRTGIKTQVIFLSKGMLERLKSEGRNSPADVILTVDVGRFKALKEANVLQPLRSRVIERNVPRKYRDPDHYWTALTTRARIIYVSKERVRPGALTTYEQLAERKWKKRICIRSGYHVYNIALIASLLAHHGESVTEKWLRGVKSNLARRPQGNDRAQVKAIKEGLCDVGIGNSYYYGKMLFNDENPEQKAWANAVALVFPNQNDRGTHMNISGAAMARYAPHKNNARKFINYLTSAEAQFIYGDINFEFPVKSSSKKPSKVQELSINFKEDDLPLQAIIDHYQQATLLLDKVNFDN